jgi:signal transduction histidine kinase
VTGRHRVATLHGPYACIVSTVATIQPAGDQLEHLRFLHHVISLATTAQTWDELLATVVDGTRDALAADVSSLYLLDRDGDHLTLAATNGLDRYQIGRARVPYGGGVTGRVAATRQPRIIADVPSDPHFLWVRGIDQRRFIASMLSVPLIWHDQVVGVLNVQTEQPRDFSESDVAQLRAIADLLAGIVERVRLQREAEDRLEELRRIDRARAELIALVTHELRTPLAVVRAYADLLAEEPALAGRASRDPERRSRRASWHEGALAQIERLDRLVDSIITTVRPTDVDQPAQRDPVDVAAVVEEVVAELEPLLRHHRIDVELDVRRHALTDPQRLRQILEHLLENAVKYAPPGSAITVTTALAEGSIRIAVADEGPGIPPEWRERIFDPYARHDTQTARGSGIGLYAAKRLAESMDAYLWCEPGPAGGACFVVGLPAIAAL